MYRVSAPVVPPSRFCSSNRPTPSTPPISLNDGPQVHLQISSITASECISKLTQSWSRSSGMPLFMIHQLLSVRTQTLSHFVTIPLLPVNKLINSVSVPSTPPINRLQVLLQSHLIMSSKCIPKDCRSWPASCGVRPYKIHRLQPALHESSNVQSPR